MRKNFDLVAILFIIAVNSTLSLPLLPLFMTRQLGATTFESSLAFIAEAALALIIVPWVSAVSDRKRRYRVTMIGALLWLALGAIALSFSKNVLLAVLVFAVFFGCFGIPSSQVFAIAQQRSAEGGDRGAEASTVRLGYVAGWVVGPALSGLLVASGLDIMRIFWLQACIYAALAGYCAIFFRSGDYPLAEKKLSKSGFKLLQEIAKAPRELKALMIVVTASLSGDIIRTALLPLVIIDELSGSYASVAAAFSVVPLVELPLVIAAIWLSKRVGDRIVILVGLGAAVLFFGLLPFIRHIPTIIAFQALYALVPATTIGVGISYAQRTIPAMPALAAGLVIAAQNCATLVGSALLGFGSFSLGVKETFFLPAAFCAFVVIVLTFGARWQHRDGG